MYRVKNRQLKQKGLLCSSLFFICVSLYAQRPNIIYIMADDLGYADLSCYGRKDYQTPNLDKLAAQGMKFTNAYAAASLCTPTRAALMTGRYPARTPVGLIEPLAGTKKDSAYGLTPADPSIATLLQLAGYETILVGKWHLGFKAEHSPLINGFDNFFGIISGAADYISHLGGAGRNVFFENETRINPKGYLTDLFSEKAVAFINQQHKKPFFMALHFTAPHWPWQGPNDKAYDDTMSFTQGGSPAVFAAMMKSMDDAVGNILNALDAKQLSGQTMVIFTSDNGGERYSDNGGLTKGKGQLWEGGIRVPAFVKWTGKIKPGSVTDQPAITMDWSNSILAAAGTKAAQDFPMDGINLAPILNGQKKNIERTFYWRNFQRNQQKAIRDGDWKYLQDAAGEYLFNIAVDPVENNDLKLKERAIFNRLKLKYQLWEKTMLEPIPL